MGRITKERSSTPTAAPAVLMPYNRATDEPVCRPNSAKAGTVAPMARVGGPNNRTIDST